MEFHQQKMTWYPSYCEFFIGGPTKYAKRITRAALVLSGILPVCWVKRPSHIVSYIKNVLVAAGIKRDALKEITIRVKEWGGALPLSYNTTCPAWCNYVGYSEIYDTGLHSTHPVDMDEVESGELKAIIEKAYYSGEIDPKYRDSGDKIDTYIEGKSFEVRDVKYIKFKVDGKKVTYPVDDLPRVPKGTPLSLERLTIHHPPSIVFEPEQGYPVREFTLTQATQLIATKFPHMSMVFYLMPFTIETFEELEDLVERDEQVPCDDPYVNEVMEWTVQELKKYQTSQPVVNNVSSDDDSDSD